LQAVTQADFVDLDRGAWQVHIRDCTGPAHTRLFVICPRAPDGIAATMRTLVEASQAAVRQSS